MSMNKPQVSIIIPVFNEELAIESTLCELINIAKGQNWEIIAVNDGSTDNTPTILKKFNDVKVVNHTRNKGYGAALKTGIAAANADTVVLFDADGQHNPADIPKLLEKIPRYDMVTGQRTKDSSQDWLRKPGKFILGKVANLLAETKIPDLNCGLRAIKRNIIMGMLDILPDGFSFSTTSTIAFFKLGLDVAYVSIVTRKRIGQSTVKQVRHGSQVLMLILRLITLFSPLRIFVNTALALFLVGLAYQIEEIARKGLHIVNGALLLIIAAIVVFLFGLMADQISGLRLAGIRGKIGE
jgi:glycosyltransferase involved in cell wall biosynthesis